MASEESKNGIPIYVSQEDVDIVLAEAAVMEQADPVSLEDVDIVSAVVDETSSESDELDYFGLLSTDDIEALLHEGDAAIDEDNAQGEVDQLIQSTLQNAGTGSSPEKSDSPATEEAGGGAVSQDDIDTLLSGSDEPPVEGAASGESPPASGEAGDGAVFQDDIDALLSGSNEAPVAGAASVESPPMSGEAGDGAVSQDDIDALLSGSDEPPVEGAASGESPPASGEAGDGAVSQDDIDALLSGAGDAFAEGAASGEVSLESEEAGGGAVSQDDIDQLLRDDASDAKKAPTDTMDGTGDDGTSMISQDDLDKLLTGAIESELPEAKETTPIAETEILAEREKKTPGEHITQEDINELLKESLLEDEDGLGEDQEDDVEEPAPVILAEDDMDEVQDEHLEEMASEKGERAIPTWYRRKPVMASLAACFLFIVVGSVLLFSGGGQETPTAPLVQSFPIPQTTDSASSMLYGETSVNLTGFLVLAPSNPSGITYMAADLFFEVADETVMGVIKDNEAFVRSIIYGVMNQAMSIQELSNVNEIQLVLAIRKALGAVIPRETIGQVYFNKFSMV